MDVGLNNKNTLGKIAPEFADVVFFIEANSNEQMSLWSEWSSDSITVIKPLSDEFIDLLPESFRPKVKTINDKIKRVEHPRVEWKQIMSGFGITIGYIKVQNDNFENEFPVCVSFSFAFINGNKVCFYDCTSRIEDHTMIEDWLTSHFQLTHDNYTRWNHTNSSNFHSCVHSLDRLDKEPRDTIYKK